MKIGIYAVGKLKENYLVDGIEEFKKRLSGYCNLEIYELPDESAPEGLSLMECEKIKNKEAVKILENIENSDYVIALDLSGKEMTSVDFSKKLASLAIEGHSKITFIIGGSLGLSQKLLNRSNLKLSFGKMTFPHQLMRLILLEQIYRAFRIMNNHPYHK